MLSNNCLGMVDYIQPHAPREVLLVFWVQRAPRRSGRAFSSAHRLGSDHDSVRFRISEEDLL